MGVLSDFFIADATAAPSYNGRSDFPPEDVCRFKRITPLEAAGVLSVLRGGGDRIEMLDEFPALTPEDAEEWVTGIPPDMTQALAQLDAVRIEDAAVACARATSEELGWSPEDFNEVLAQLCVLARRAMKKGKAMYLWNSL